MSLILKSTTIATTSTTSLFAFLSQIFDLENLVDQNGNFIQLDQQKVYIKEIPQFVFPDFIELEIEENLSTFRERLEFFTYRSTEQVAIKVESFSMEDNFLLATDFEQRNWLIRSKL